MQGVNLTRKESRNKRVLFYGHGSGDEPLNFRFAGAVQDFHPDKAPGDSRLHICRNRQLLQLVENRCMARLPYNPRNHR